MQYRTEPLIQVANVIDSLHKTPKYDNNGAYSMVRATDIQYGVLELSSTYKVNTDVYNQFSKNYKPSKDDTLIVRVGVSYGRIALVGDINFCLGQNTAAIIPTISKRYIYYVLSSPYIKKQIDTYIVGAAQPTLSLKAIKALEIPRFGEAIENKIAHILSTLDDKIELNRKMNQTLEEMAQVLFKSWFVDFDPVHAKADAKSDAELDAVATELGIVKEVLELFPSEFVESEMGMIPLGWEWRTFGEVLTPKKGKVITKKRITEGTIPVVAGGLTPAYYHNEYNAKSPVITVSASGVNAGFVNLYSQDIWASDCSYINHEMTDFVYATYLFLSLKQDKITRMQQGAAQPHVYPKDLMRLVIAKPALNLWSFLEKRIEPMFKKIKNNEKEIQALAKTRDTLLPKLLSGELDVSELEVN